VWITGTVVSDNTTGMVHVSVIAPPSMTLAPCVIFTQSKGASDSSGYFGAYLICYKHLVIVTVYCVVNVQIENL
jgi:hypothetical protein